MQQTSLNDRNNNNNNNNNFFLFLGRYIPEEGKKLMKKIGVWSSTNPCGQNNNNNHHHHHYKSTLWYIGVVQ